jgi:hypothetical protein
VKTFTQHDPLTDAESASWSKRAFVGSRTGAMLRRFSLAWVSPFPLGVPQ